MPTQLHQTKRNQIGHPFHLAAQVGAIIAPNPIYPSFGHEVGNAFLTVLHSVLVDDGLVQVVGDGENGYYEWVWFRENGDTIYTKAGWGSPGNPLHDALNHAYEGCKY